MKVLLINPSMNRSSSRISSFFPSGLTYLASYLRKSGFDIRIVDFQGMMPGKVEEEIQFFNPEVVGISCLFSHYLPSVKAIAKIVKKKNSNIYVAIGGLHPTLFHKQLIEEIREIDFIVLGEGEISFLQLCNKLKDKAASLDDIDGLVYRRSGGAVKVNPKTKFIENLDELPFPAFDKINMDKYFFHLRYNKNNRGMSIVTSRSCPNRCTFCSMFHSHGYKWRARSPENVIDEMEFLYNKYGIRNFQFMDDNMSFSKERTMKIFKGTINRGMKITFNFPNGISIKTLDREVIELMKESGCVEIRLPIESGSEYIRNEVMRKNLPENKIFEVIELCNEFKIPTIGYFIVGMPGEDHRTMEENFNFIKKLRGRWFVDFIAANFATPYPGTALYDQCLRERLIEDKTVKHLIDGTLTIFDKPVIKLKTLTENELINYRNKLWRIFFGVNFFRIMLKYTKPTRDNYQIFRAVTHRFVSGY